MDCLSLQILRNSYGQLGRAGLGFSPDYYQSKSGQIILWPLPGRLGGFTHLNRAPQSQPSTDSFHRRQHLSQPLPPVNRGQI